MGAGEKYIRNRILIFLKVTKKKVCNYIEKETRSKYFKVCNNSNL